MTFTDPAIGFLENPSLNAFYRVVAMAGTVASLPSNEVGEFEWGLAGSARMVPISR
jgi:hypothetical protein